MCRIAPVAIDSTRLSRHLDILQNRDTSISRRIEDIAVLQWTPSHDSHETRRGSSLCFSGSSSLESEFQIIIASIS